MINGLSADQLTSNEIDMPVHKTLDVKKKSNNKTNIVNRQNRQVLCRIFYIKIKNPKVSPIIVSFGFLSFGGDGGNRNRVLKPLIKAFYMLSLLFGIPPATRQQTALSLR